MGLLPFPLFTFLAFAGLSDDAVEQINHVGWLLPFLAIAVPVGLIACIALAKVGYLILGAAQITAIVFGLRALSAHLRRTGFNSYQIKIMMIPFYLVACFLTNIVALIGFGVARKFF